MKLNISLGIYNGNGSSADIDTKDGQSMRLATGYNLSAKAACRRAAKDLRDAANRFDLLAEEQEPYKRGTHDKINRTSREKILHKKYLDGFPENNLYPNEATP